MKLAVAALLLWCAVLGAAPPQRIISTAPSITETLFALGLGNRVVGVTQYCRYPAEVNRIPRIGTWTTPNMEAILAARPDLIVVQRTAVHTASRFNAVGLKTLEVKIDRLADIFSAIDAIGRAAGVPERAYNLQVSLRRGLNEVRQQVASKPRTSMMFIVGRTPGTLEGIVAAGGQSYISEAISLAGGRNVFEDSPLGYAKILHEEILVRDPEVILDMGEHADANAVPESRRRAEAALWNRYRGVRAVKDRRVHIVSSEMFVVPGPRVLNLVRELARLLHPELSR